MEHERIEECIGIAQLAEVTSDCLAVCEADGTIVDVNLHLADLMGLSRHWIVGGDVKDILFSLSFERSTGHRLPFSADGTEARLMLKLADGSFVPVSVRAGRLGESGRMLVAMRSLEDVCARDRERERLLEELEMANRRLSGTLSVIMSTVGADDLPTLVRCVLDQLARTLDAKGSTVYLSEGGGFRLRGVSEGLAGERVPTFVPYGAGVPTLVVRESRPVRLVYMPDSETARSARRLSGVFLDLDAHERRRLRVQNIPPFKTMVAVPIYYGTHILGILETGWDRPYTPRETDVHVLEVVCEYFAIELMGLVTSLRSRRRAELTKSLSRLREFFFSQEGDVRRALSLMGGEVRAQLGCRAYELVEDEDGAYFDFGRAGRFVLPENIEEVLASTSSPAVHMGRVERDAFVYSREELVSTIDAEGADDRPSMDEARLTRIDESTLLGEWLAAHGLPCQGILVELGEDEGGRHAILLTRETDEEPIDDMEYDYLAHMVHDYELFRRGLAVKKEDRRIAQALQRGMESSLASVPGITTDSLYSSATQQALVGGDFFDLIRLPDECAVMILGDASGKGVEAASTSAFVKTALRAYAWEGMSPARMADALNGMLMNFSRLETFATMFIGHIDLRASRVVYCSAGHPPAMVYRAGSREVELLGTQSGIVGAFPGACYENGSFEFGQGDILFLYTDGAIEARRDDGAFFGEDRLKELLLHIAGQGIHGLCQRVLYELDRFTSGALNDDIAMVALRFDSAVADKGDERSRESDVPVE